MNKPFDHTVFRDAIADLECLGLKVSDRASECAKTYALICGRSNARWWLIPLENSRVAASGLALFQPLLTSARIMKATTSILSRLGMSYLWVRGKVFITGKPSLARYVQSDYPLAFSYFTGTDSPHRKIAVQIMDVQGNIKGFAKLTRNPKVRTLLAHEAATLERVHSLGLQAGYIPKVLFFGDQCGGTLLVTDTMKTSKTASTTRFTTAHRDFLQELAQKTAILNGVSTAELAAGFRARFNLISAQLETDWRQRLDNAISTLETRTNLQLPACLSHGDFTPWNTFMSNDRLYVFDWEYAEQSLPSSNDIIHFVLSEPQMRGQSASSKIEAIMTCLSQPWTGIQKEAAPALLIIYLLTQTLRQIERLPDAAKKTGWDGQTESAEMVNNLLANKMTIHA